MSVAWLRWTSGLTAVLMAAVLVLVLALVPRADGPDGLPAGANGPLGPVDRPCTGVPLSTADDLHGALRANPPGTTFCLAAGVHRITEPVTPRKGDSFVGAPGAVLSGSVQLRGWQRQASGWTTAGVLPPSPGIHGECRSEVPTCAVAEDVFLDGVRLKRVTSPSEIGSRTVFADYDAGSITIGDDPAGRLVEQAVAPALIRAVVDDVTVEGLILEQAANEAQVGALENRDVPTGRAGTGWRIRNNDIRLNHGAGIGIGGSSTVTGNRIHHQGQIGYGTWGSGSLLRDNEIAYNGVAGYSAEWEAGGGKAYLTTGLTIVHNDVHDNLGPGLWTDGGNIGTTYSRNRICRNGRAGIQHEVSYDATITHNEIFGNGREQQGWAWGAGVQIQSSGGLRVVEVAHNVVSGGANGITVVDSGERTNEDPAPHGPHVVKNVRVHDNRIVMEPGGLTGVVEDRGDDAVFTTRNIRFDANTYVLPSVDVPVFAWAGSELSWREWRRTGNDVHGQVEVLGGG